MPAVNNIEVVRETSLGGVLLGGISSLIDGVVLFGQLSAQQQLMERFPEAFAANQPAIVTDPAVAERLAAKRQPLSLDSVFSVVTNASPLVIGAVGVGVLALVIALRS